jgi:hypothetical protein
VSSSTAGTDSRSSAHSRASICCSTDRDLEGPGDDDLCRRLGLHAEARTSSQRLCMAA